MAVKLAPTEAKRLAAVLQRLARPRTAEEAAEIDHWVRRLEGARS